jgi:hypothetical protein
LGKLKLSRDQSHTYNKTGQSVFLRLQIVSTALGLKQEWNHTQWLQDAMSHRLLLHVRQEGLRSLSGWTFCGHLEMAAAGHNGSGASSRLPGLPLTCPVILTMFNHAELWFLHLRTWKDTFTTS